MAHASASPLLPSSVSLSAPTAVIPEPADATSHVGVYGLRVRSDIPLPDWPQVPAGTPDLVVRREHYDGATFEADRFQTIVRFVDGEARFEIRDVGKFVASGGSLIRVAPEPHALREDVRLFLTGAVMGAVLHQRGTFPLHASCVAIDGVGAAFAAPSGEGKSTLVGALVERGATFVSDDICAMTSDAAGVPSVWPGAPRLKLDETGLAAMTASVHGLEPAGGDRDKFHLPVEESLDWASPVPLRRVYLLASGDGPPRIDRISGLDAVSALVEQTYFLPYAAGLRVSARVFRMAATLARQVVVSRLTRPRGLDRMPEVTDLIARDLAAP